jgi:hypothetical protein
VDAGLRRVDLLGALLEVLVNPVPHVPVPAHGHDPELGEEREVRGLAHRDHDPVEVARGGVRPAALEQAPRHAAARVRRRDPQLGHLVHAGKAGDDHVADDPLLVLGDEEAAALLGRHELEQRAVPAPLAAELLLGAHPLLGQEAARMARLVPGRLAEEIDALEIGRAALAERGLAHASAARSPDASPA